MTDDKVYAASFDGRIVAWRLADDEVVLNMKAEAEVRAAAFSHDSKYCLLGCADHQVRLVKLESAKLVKLEGLKSLSAASPSHRTARSSPRGAPTRPSGFGTSRLER